MKTLAQPSQDPWDPLSLSLQAAVMCKTCLASGKAVLFFPSDGMECQSVDNFKVFNWFQNVTEILAAVAFHLKRIVF